MKPRMKPLGTIFQTTSIDDCAREAVKFSRGWGGGIVVSLDDSGACCVHVADTPVADRFLARNPGDVVGVYEIECGGNNRQRLDSIRRIAEDIFHHHQLRRLAA